LSVILINIAAAYPHHHFGQADGYVDRGLRSLYDAVINEGGNVDFASLVSSNQDNIIFSERFEGPIKIVENGTVPSVNHTDLSVETVFTGINFTSNMAFLRPDDILYLEKNNGTVNRITNGVMLDKPLLDLDVVHSDGLLGIAVSKNERGPTYVFLYFTELLIIPMVKSESVIVFTDTN
jgi:hypothetical protein